MHAIRVSGGIILALALLLAFPVAAHDPSIEEEDWGGFDAPYQTADATVSYALYGYLDEADVDVFTLDFPEADMLLRAELLTPVCGEHYADFYPQMVIFAPAADGVTPIEVALPFDVPEGLVPIYTSAAARPEATPEPEGERPTFVEPIGGTTFYESLRTDLTVTTAGRYWVAVYNPDGQTGDYALATGYREVFNSSPVQVMQAVAAIRSGEWLHRRCDLSPDDPDAVIEHDQHADGG